MQLWETQTIWKIHSIWAQGRVMRSHYSHLEERFNHTLTSGNPITMLFHSSINKILFSKSSNSKWTRLKGRSILPQARCSRNQNCNPLMSINCDLIIVMLNILIITSLPCWLSPCLRPCSTSLRGAWVCRPWCGWWQCPGWPCDRGWWSWTPCRSWPCAVSHPWPSTLHPWVFRPPPCPDPPPCAPPSPLVASALL